MRWRVCFYNSMFVTPSHLSEHKIVGQQHNLCKRMGRSRLTTIRAHRKRDRHRHTQHCYRFMITQNWKTEHNACIAWNGSMAFHTYAFQSFAFIGYTIGFHLSSEPLTWNFKCHIQFIALIITIICFTLFEFNDKTPEVWIDWNKTFYRMI